MELDEVKEWCRRPSTLWLCGPTGFGKSVLAAHFVESKIFRAKFSSAVITYFFCSGFNENLREAHQVIRTFLAQICISSHDVRTRLLEILGSDEDFERTPHTIAEITQFFKHLVSAALELNKRTNIVFVIDGINECADEHRVLILHFLKLLRVYCGAHILITSQRSPELTAELRHSEDVIYKELTSADNDDLIDRFIKLSLEKHSELITSFAAIGIPDPLQYLRARHHGMFLWISTLMEELPKSCGRKNEFETTLKTVPGKANAVFQQALKRLEKEQSRHLKTPHTSNTILELLTWLALSKRDMRVCELTVGMNLTAMLRSGNENEDPIINISPELQALGGLIRLSHAEAVGERIASTHFSFRLFLTNEKQCRNDFFIKGNEGQSLVSAACIRYLASEKLQRPKDMANPTTIRRKVDNDYPLFGYASDHVCSHLQDITRADNPIIITNLRQLCSREGLYAWFSSLLEYIDQTDSWLDDNHLKKIVPTVVEIRNWVRKEGLEIKILADVGRAQTNSGMSIIKFFSRGVRNVIKSNEAPDLIDRACAIASEIWVTGDPYSAPRAIAAYEITNQLYLTHEGSNQPGSAVQYFKSLTQDATYYANRGHLNKWLQTTESLREANTQYENSLTAKFDPYMLSCLAGTHLMIYFREKKDEDLSAALSYSLRSIGLLSDDIQKGEAMSTLSEIYGTFYHAKKENPALLKSMHCAREAVQLIPTESPSVWRTNLTLGRALQQMFQHYGDADALVESVELLEGLPKLLSPTHWARTQVLQALADGLWLRAVAQGSIIDVSRACDTLREAMTIASNDALLMEKLSQFLAITYDLTKSEVIAKKGMGLARGALSVNKDSTVWALSEWLQREFERTEDPDKLTQLLAFRKQMMESTTEWSYGFLRQRKYAAALLLKFEHTSRTESDILKQAVELAEKAIREVPPKGLFLPSVALTLGEALLLEAESGLLANESTVDRAITMLYISWVRASSKLDRPIREKVRPLLERAVKISSIIKYS
jgi:NACHT domain